VEWSSTDEGLAFAPSPVVLRALDTPVLSAGLLSPFPTPGNWSIDLSTGFHANLQNNIWNVNFPQWYPFESVDKDARFRFEVDVS
jgi:hypothetical protein